ncbi:MAG TPA: heavy metal-associated domain-containing protein [Myxococcales bacterium]|jgi:copper chaperone CopZ|nr:heavy metal-associated domain-containing protein [Myxococcales bacterium]
MRRIALVMFALAGAALAAEQSLSLRVEGWHSKGDVYKTEAAVQQVKGVLRVSSDLGKKELTVHFDDGVANAAGIQKAISGAGYVSHR